MSSRLRLCTPGDICSLTVTFGVTANNPRRFVAASRRYDEHLKLTQPEQGEEEERAIQEAGSGSAAEGGEKGKAVAQESAQDDGKPAGAPDDASARIVNTGGGRAGAGGRDENNDRPIDGREAEGSDSPPEEEDLIGDQMQTDVLEAMKELRQCMIFHDM